MPNNTFYESKSYPTIFDYTNKVNENGLAIIDEIQYETNFLRNAMLKPTNDGLRERYTRKSEEFHSPSFASLDEHYKPSSVKTTNEEKSFGTMRIIDRIQWEHRQDVIATPEEMAAQRAEELRVIIDGFVDAKQKAMLYSLSQEDADTANVVTVGKKEPGLFSMLEKVYDSTDIAALYKRYEDRKNPFTNVGEDLVALSNYKSGRTSDANYSSSKDCWTSIIGVAFGTNGVVTTYPEAVRAGAGAGFNMDIKSDIESGDDKDGYYTYDRINFDAYFGIGVKNRYCLNGIRNIYLGHTDKTALCDEMEAVENNLITLKDFFNLGKTGMALEFYCSPRLITQMEIYQKEKAGSATITYMAQIGSREFNGMNPRKRPDSIQITSDIILHSDYCFKTSEKFVSGEIGTI